MAEPALRPLHSSELTLLREVFPTESDAALTARVATAHERATRGVDPAHLYRCVRDVMYLQPRVARLPEYAAALARAPGGGLWVDVGAGPGTDVRKVVLDGWPASRAAAVDVTSQLWPLGEALFGAAPCALTLCDVAAAPPPAALAHAASVVSLVSVLHTMDRALLEAFVRGLRALLAPGGLVIGSTVGADAPREWTFPAAAGCATRWLCSAGSLAEMLAAAGLVDVRVTEHALDGDEAGVGGGLRSSGALREPWQRMLSFAAREPA